MHEWRKYYLRRPYMSMKWGRGPAECEWRAGLWELEERNNP